MPTPVIVILCALSQNSASAPNLGSADSVASSTNAESKSASPPPRLQLKLPKNTVKVAVDGTEVGWSSPLTIAEGEHQLEVQLKNGRTFRDVVRVEATPRAFVEVPAEDFSYTTAQRAMVATGSAEAAIGLALAMSYFSSRDRSIDAAGGVLRGRFVLTDDAPRRYVRTWGIPAVPVGTALIVAGAATSIGTWLFDDVENSQWWSALVGHAAAGFGLALAMVLEPRIDRDDVVTIGGR